MSLYKEGPLWQRQPDKTKIVVNDPLAGAGSPDTVIYNESQWRICKVSPLYNLSYDALKLKQYSSKIRQNIVSNVTSNLSVKYTVTADVLVNLKYTEEDAHGLMITVFSTKETNNNNNKAKESYKAVLLSWGAFSRLQEAIHLPYLLEKGEQKIGSAVKATLQTIFDCNITPFTFTQNQLLQLGFNFLDHDSSRDNETFRISLKTPQVEHKDSLKINLQLGDVKILWNEVKEEVTKTSELISRTYQIVQNQIYHTLKFDISVFELCDVRTPKAEVRSDGIVKMKTPEAVNCVFTVINEICSNNYDTKEL